MVSDPIETVAVSIQSQRSPRAVLAATACALCMSLGLAALFIGTFPVFLEPLSRQFGWGLSVFPRALLVAAATSALVGPFAGRLIDRYGVRPLMLGGMAVWGACLLAISFARRDFLILYAIPALMGVSSACAGPISFVKVVSGWFNAHRGLVLGLVISAAPAAATAVAVLSARELIAVFGWRTAYRILGAVVLLIGWPVALLFMREAPVTSAENPPRPDMAAAERMLPPGLTTAAAVRTRDFWLLIGVTCLICGAINGIVSHFVAWSDERGLSTLTATEALSLFSLIGPVGPILAGMAVDRVRTQRVLFIFYALPLLGLSLLVLLGAAMQVPGMALLGFGFSAASGLLPYLVSRYFGLRSASEIFGLALGVVTLSMGMGPVLLGLGREHAGSYRAPVSLTFVALALALVLAAALRRYQFDTHPARHS
jgi:MFS family permease